MVTPKPVVGGPDTEYTCSSCHLGLTDRIETQRHIGAVHLNWSPFECNSCPMKFVLEIDLDFHGTSVHPNEDFVRKIDEVSLIEMKAKLEKLTSESSNQLLVPVPAETSSNNVRDSHEEFDNSNDEEQKLDSEPSELNPDPDSPPDGGWGWLIVISTAIINFMVDGHTYSFGILLPDIQQEYGCRANATWIGSFMTAGILITGCVASILVHKFGPRKVIMFGGLWAAVCLFCSSLSPDFALLMAPYDLGAIGLGLAQQASIVQVSLYFEKRRALATGIAVAGSGLGTIVFPIFTQEVIEEYRWRGVLALSSALLLSIVVCGFVQRPVRRERERAELETIIEMYDRGQHRGPRQDSQGELHEAAQEINAAAPDTTSMTQSKVLDKVRHLISKVLHSLIELFGFRLLKNPLMSLLCVSNVFGRLAFYCPFVFLPMYATEIGVEPKDASFLITCIGISNTIARVLFGWFADKKWMRAITINNFGLFGCAISTGLVPFLQSYPLLVCNSIAFGFCLAPHVSLTSIILMDFFGAERLPKTFGLLLLFRGLSSLFGAPLAGWIVDLTGTVAAAFFYSSLFFFLSAVFSVLVDEVAKRKSVESASV